MTVAEFTGIIDDSDKVQVIKGGTAIYTGFLALMRHTSLEKEIMESQVTKFKAVLEIRHKKWREKGLMPPMKPEETPDYSFTDLQTTLYYKIHI